MVQIAATSSQGGVLQGTNPSQYNPSNPVILFIIQAGIIIIFCRLLHFPLSKIRQPRVIAEIIGGILLGPSVMGRIPGFTNAIFPTASMPVLNNAANIGLILFLFLVGLEVDLRLLASNWRIALSVGLLGMALPFGLGCAIAYGLYHQFRHDAGLVPISFGTYMLFVGVAMAITAFPVLCRILTELKLLHTQVGVVVLSAGIGNDVVGWILLALCVALVNAGSGITALYVLLVCFGYVLFLCFVVRPAFFWLLRRSGNIENGPSQSIVALTILMVLTSAFFTGVCGVHPIFGAFLVGLICPHEGGFAIKMTEKIEDLVGVFFLPLYFALSGLSTNIGLLDNGITWAYVVGVIAVAFLGKFIGGTLAARLNKMLWRESFTVGTLMSCKGLVELIVLNIGYQAKILSQRTFTIFVVMALITTFATTPLTTWLFPPSYQQKVDAWKRGEIDWDGNPLTHRVDSTAADSDLSMEKQPGSNIRRLLVSLRLDSLPALFTLVDLFGAERTDTAPVKAHPSSDDGAPKRTQAETQAPVGPPQRPLEVHGLRLLGLTDRLSSIMKESDADEWSARDPVVNAFHTFSQLHNVAVSADVQMAPEGSYADILSDRALQRRSDMILLPWSETGSHTEHITLRLGENTHNPFNHPNYNSFIEKLLRTAPCSTAVFINNGFGAARREDALTSKPSLKRAATGLSIRSHTDLPATAPLRDRSHHIFMPYFGGFDDHVALTLLLRLAQNPSVTATVVYFRQTGSQDKDENLSTKEANVTGESPVATSPTSSTFPAGSGFIASAFAASRSKTDVQDQAEVRQPTIEDDASYFTQQHVLLPEDVRRRVVFQEVSYLASDHHVLQETLARAAQEVGHDRKSTGDLVIVGLGRSSKWHSLALRGSEQREHQQPELARTLGGVAEALITEKIQASVVVVQAGEKI